MLTSFIFLLAVNPYYKFVFVGICGGNYGRQKSDTMIIFFFPIQSFFYGSC